MKIAVWNILDMVEEYGEDSVKEILSVFSCKREKGEEAISLNPDIEHFIKNNAIQFARQKVSVSYIVGDEDDGAVRQEPIWFRVSSSRSSERIML